MDKSYVQYVKQEAQVKEKFKEIIKYSQGINKPKVDELFKRWEDAKWDFLTAFNGELIYSCGEVEFPLDESAKTKKFEDFCHFVDRQIFWEDARLREDFYDFLSWNSDGFCDNKTTAPYRTVENKMIPAGAKLVKAFKAFFKNNEVLRSVQDYASTLIQENKIKGELCFSIHPFDYLSLSANAMGWRSCHALDGEYCAGNLSYMVDNSTIICYIREKEEKKINWFPFKWNSKKWRMVLYFSENRDMIFAGRQYPFTSTVGQEIVLQKVKEIFNEEVWPWLDNGFWGNWRTEKINSIGDRPLMADYLELRGRLLDFEAVMKDAPYSLHYNDVLLSPHYTPAYVLYDNEVLGSWRENPSFWVGGEVKCLECGKYRIEEQDGMRCSFCISKHKNELDRYGRCDICDTRHFAEDLTLDDGGYLICPKCLKKYYATCPHCGKLLYKGLDDKTICYCGNEVK